MNLILEKSRFVDFYTYLDPIFEAAPELADFNYLISNFETGGPWHESLTSDPVILSGALLSEIVRARKIQFIWGVLSAFKGDPTIPRELPYADGNRGFWTSRPKPQIKEAEFEIVCWDSGCTLFIGISSSVGAKLQHRYPDIQDLDEWNRKHG